MSTFSSASTGRLPVKAEKRTGGVASASSSYSSVSSISSKFMRPAGGAAGKKEEKPRPLPQRNSPKRRNNGRAVYDPSATTGAAAADKENTHARLHRVLFHSAAAPTPHAGGGPAIRIAGGGVAGAGSLPPPPVPAVSAGLPTPTPRTRAPSPPSPPAPSSSTTTTPSGSASDNPAPPSLPSVTSSPSVNNVLFEVGPKIFFRTTPSGDVRGVHDDLDCPSPHRDDGAGDDDDGASGAGGTRGASGNERDCSGNVGGSYGSVTASKGGAVALEMAAALKLAVDASDRIEALRLADETWTRVVDGMLAAPEKEQDDLVPLVAALMANVATTFDASPHLLAGGCGHARRCCRRRRRFYSSFVSALPWLAALGAVAFLVPLFMVAPTIVPPPT